MIGGNKITCDRLSWKPNLTITANPDLAKRKRNGTNTEKSIENYVTSTDSRTLKEMQNDLSNPGAQQRVRILISARAKHSRQ